MASKGENRLKSYKTKGLDVEEVRRRREEEGVQLRRSRREEQVRCGVGLARGRGLYLSMLPTCLKTCGVFGRRGKRGCTFI